MGCFKALLRLRLRQNERTARELNLMVQQSQEKVMDEAGVLEALKLAVLQQNWVGKVSFRTAAGEETGESGEGSSLGLGGEDSASRRNRRTQGVRRQSLWTHCEHHAFGRFWCIQMTCST